jgi:predicted 2-oxoglutarate/Fe(II)-dependent dioxygenase YbiX
MYLGHFDLQQPLLDTIDGVMSIEECRTLIARAETGPWLHATVNGFEGREVRANVRNNMLAMIEDAALPSLILDRVRARLPRTIKGLRLTRIKDRFRVYRYREGEHFGLHNDQSYAGDEGELSQLTFMLYLNDEFVGGETDFPEIERTILPQAGRVLWFQHMLLHEGRRVERGVKYVLRSDVLYAPSSESP